MKPMKTTSMKTYEDAVAARDSLAAYMEETGEATRAASWVATRINSTICRRQRVASELKGGKLTWPPSRPHLVEDEKVSALKGAFAELHKSLNTTPTDVQGLAHDLAHGVYTLAWDVTSEVTGFWPSREGTSNIWPEFEHELNISFNALAEELIEWINSQRAKQVVDIKA
jgi:hypothetical protein